MTRTAAEKAAADNHRTLASLIEKLLVEYLREHGYLKKGRRHRRGFYGRRRSADQREELGAEGAETVSLHPAVLKELCHTSNLATAAAPFTISRAIDSASLSVSAENRWTATILPLEANERSV